MTTFGCCRDGTIDRLQNATGRGVVALRATAIAEREERSLYEVPSAPCNVLAMGTHQTELKQDKSPRNPHSKSLWPSRAFISSVLLGLLKNISQVRTRRSSQPRPERDTLGCRDQPADVNPSSQPATRGRHAHAHLNRRCHERGAKIYRVHNVTPLTVNATLFTTAT
ncbi:hypothetical protein Taro_033322 [Colocasia esculenta]|uniref:Uncharacterized protein n=1 Tax=Colocasia esculenta TaxID=4460 RepID=A0A843VNI4_COLES|nr:hypothetical protein [Colocasia esculenta]